jgi:nitrogen-specific signal transduction histidine kinase/CheY-like chemotaxis protein
VNCEPQRLKIDLSPEQFSDLFPYHFLLDDDLNFLGAGVVLERVCPEVKKGAALTAVFEILRPSGAPSRDWILKHAHNFFLFRHRSNGFQLRGGFIRALKADCYIFLGSPWFSDPSQLKTFGLTAADFSVTDPWVDMLHVLQASKVAVADAHLLSSKLSRKSAQLQLANKQLRESELFASATLNSLRSALLILDERGVIISSNRASIELANNSGLDAEAFSVGVNYLDGFMTSRHAPPAAAELVAGIREVMAGSRKDFELDYHWHSADKPRWFICRANRFSEEYPVRVLVSNRENTQMKALQVLQNRSQRMESLGTLASGIAHDLNNALAPIILVGDALRKQYSEKTDLLDVIQTSAKRAADMVQKLLTFSKGAEGERTSIEVGRLVGEVQDIIKSTFPKNIELRVELAPDLPNIIGDSTQLHQILLNLCVNARDAMPLGGRLTLGAKLAEVDSVYAAANPEARPGRYVRLSVSDTGTGIPHDTMERIFEPFFTTKGALGTGLGLSTVLGLVKGHGGFVQVYSRLGKGSVFAVHFPLDLGGGEMPRLLKNHPEIRGKGEGILLVDDEAAIRRTACAVLTHRGFKPLAASDGVEGLFMANQHMADLSAVILDMDMPHMNGLALAQALRRLSSTLPIAAMSGRFSEAALAELRELRVSVQLAKPFTEIQLVEAIGKLIRLTPEVPP